MIDREFYFKPRLRVLSDEQIDQLHMSTLEVLERTGVQITHPRALELLDGAGARVTDDRVHIPSWMVEDAIRKAPPHVVLGRRNGERSVLLGGDKAWFGPSLDCVDYLDPLTDERRPFTSDDCRVTSTVAELLGANGVICAPLLGYAVPPTSRANTSRTVDGSIRRFQFRLVPPVFDTSTV